MITMIQLPQPPVNTNTVINHKNMKNNFHPFQPLVRHLQNKEKEECQSCRHNGIELQSKPSSAVVAAATISRRDPLLLLLPEGGKNKGWTVKFVRRKE